MKASFLLVGDPQSSWSLTLARSLAPLGQLQLIDEKEVNQKVLQRHYDLIIVDAAIVKVVPLIKRVLAYTPEARIVVATLSPTWQRAREALRAGAIGYIHRLQNEEELRSTIKQFLQKPQSNNQEEV